ncbi:MAG: hypothetical protein ABI054_11920 [Planctomycetota bacterium]
MALQSQSSSPVSEFSALIRRRLWNILLPFAFITALGVMIAELMPKTYMVTTIVKLPESGLVGTGTTIQRDASSAQNDMKAEPLVRSVIESQEWSDFVGLPEKEKVDYVKRVISNLIVKVQSPGKGIGGSNYINVSYSDADGVRAERFVNTLRERYVDGVVTAVRAEARATRDVLKDLKEEHYNVYKEAEKARSDLAKRQGLSATQPAPGSGQARGEDPVYARLTQSEIELAATDKELDAERAKLEFTEALFANEPESILESEAAAAVKAAGTNGAKTPVVDDVEKQIRDLEMQISDQREKQKEYRPPNRRYQLIDDDVGKLEAKIAILKGEGTGGTKSRAQKFVANPLRATLDQTIRDAKTKIAGLSSTKSSLATTISSLRSEALVRADVYTQLNYLTADVQLADDNFRMTEARWMQECTRVTLLEGPQANPFELMEAAKASDIPTAPNVPVFIAISAFLGLAVGLGSALAGEFLRNGFKGISDLTRGIAVPVLGAVNLITTREQKRRNLIRHAMIAGSSAVIVSAILWITWAWQHDSLRLLGPGLTQLIDDVRKWFRP